MKWIICIGRSTDFSSEVRSEQSVAMAAVILMAVSVTVASHPGKGTQSDPAGEGKLQ